MTLLYVGDRVRMVDRFAARQLCKCRTYEPSWFNGMRGKVTQVSPLMVLLDGERLPMRFDERDMDRVVDEPSEPNMSGAE